MEQLFAKYIGAHPQSHELVKLIRKLRWIGREEEALRIQSALRIASDDYNEPREQIVSGENL